MRKNIKPTRPPKRTPDRNDPAYRWPGYVLALHDGEDLKALKARLATNPDVRVWPDDRIKHPHVLCVKARSVETLERLVGFDARIYKKDDVLDTKKTHLLKTFRVEAEPGAGVTLEDFETLRAVFTRSLIVVYDPHSQAGDPEVFDVQALYAGMVEREITHSGVQGLSVEELRH